MTAPPRDAGRLPLGTFTVDAPPAWRDVSEPSDGDGAPFTLARIGDDPDAGVGALQLSPPLDRPGVPHPGAAELLALAEEFGESNSLGLPFDRATDDGPPAIGAVSYHRDEDFIRIWFVATGTRLVLVTYVAEAGAEGEELPECEAIVRSIRFGTAPPAA